jgi:hypothetical protein
MLGENHARIQLGLVINTTVEFLIEMITDLPRHTAARRMPNECWPCLLHVPWGCHRWYRVQLARRCVCNANEHTVITT